MKQGYCDVLFETFLKENFPRDEDSVFMDIRAEINTPQAVKGISPSVEHDLSRRIRLTAERFDSVYPKVTDPLLLNTTWDNTPIECDYGTSYSTLYANSAPEIPSDSSCPLRILSDSDIA